MHYSFEDIEKQAQATHAKAHSVLKEKSIIAKNFKSIGVLTLSAMLVGVSFMASNNNFGSFSANLLNEEDFFGEATEVNVFDVEPSTAVAISEQKTDDEEIVGDAVTIDITPVKVAETVEKTSDIATEGNPFLATTNTAAPTESPANPFLSAQNNTPTQEINPFLSINNNTNTAAEETEEETFYGSPEDNYPVKAIEPEVIPDVFKQNPYTFDSVVDSIPSDGVESDPLAEEETFYGVTEIVDIVDFERVDPSEVFSTTTSYETETVGTQRFTGTLELASTSENSPYAFAFKLRLEDQSHLFFETHRDLRNVEGKELTIEIEGTRNDFVLKHVFYKKAELAKSGPEGVIAGLSMLAATGAMLRRKWMK